MVRVFRNSGGQLHYVGIDFFHGGPKDSVGAWVPVDLSELQAAADTVLQETYLHIAVAEFRENQWRGEGRKEFLAFLTEKHGAVGWPRKFREPEHEQRALALVDLAEELGLLTS